MLVVSDTTPIISLIKANQLHLLKELFQKIYIPVAVYNELITNTNFPKEAELMNKADFITIESVQNPHSVTVLRQATSIDAGESEAIILATEKNADVLLIDERRGRQVAKNMKLPMTGTIGLLIRAFDEGKISVSDIENCITLLQQANIRIDDALYDLLRKHTGIL